MNASQIASKHQTLINAAIKVLQKNADPIRHSVGAAVLCASGSIYTGVNIESSGFGVCAEPVALGTALSSGERNIVAMVAVSKRDGGYAVLSPCGNCRQILLDYAPEATVIYQDSNQVILTKAKNLLPGAYISRDFGKP